MTLHPYEGPRGLTGYTRITDTDGSTIEIQESSAVWVFSFVTDIDGPFCWLRIYDDEWKASIPTGGGEGMHASGHLTPENAREIIAGLQSWLDDI